MIELAVAAGVSLLAPTRSNDVAQRNFLNDVAFGVILTAVAFPLDTMGCTNRG